jgi:hypothetical protein
MGWTQEVLTVRASLSNHNSEQDTLDETAWHKFARAVRDLAEQSEVAGLNLNVIGGEEDW